MKNLLTLLCVTTCIYVSRAQTPSLPQKEFSVALTSETVEIKKGESHPIEILILKSKSYKNAQATMGVSSSLPQGITVHFEPAEGLMDKTNAVIAVDSNATAGEYNVILNSTMRYHTKGAILKLVVR